MSFLGEVHLDIKDHMTFNVCWRPIIAFLCCSRNMITYNAFFITFSMAFYHKYVPVMSSSSKTSLTNFRINTPNQTHEFIPISWPYLCNNPNAFPRNVFSTSDQKNAGSLAILFAIAYCATSAGLCSLRSFNSVQLVDQSFHCSSGC